MERLTKILNNLWFCLKLLYNADRKVFALLMIMNVVVTIAPISLLGVSRTILNEIVSSISGTNTSNTLLLLIVLYFLINIMLGFGNDYVNKVSLITTQELIKHININLMDKSIAMDISYFDSPHQYDEMNISRKNARELHKIVFSITRMIGSIVKLISSLLIAITINSWFVILVILSVVPKYLFKRKLEFVAYKFDKEQANDTRRIGYIYSLFFNKDAAQEMRYYSVIDNLINQYSSLQTATFKKRNRFNIQNNLRELLVTSPSTIVKIFISIHTIYKISRRLLSVGDYTYITGIYSSISSALDAILSTAAIVEGYSAKIDDYKQYFDYDEALVVGNKELKAIHSLEFKNVSFTYPNSEKRLLNNVSFKIEKNEKVMLVGENGAGKTTIIKLICGFYTNYSGVILVNGCNIKDYNIYAVRSHMASVFQDFTIYSFTLRENVAFGDLNELRNNSLLIDCLNNASYHNTQLDKYINKDFEEDGIIPSGGQKQKIAIARAYVRKPELIMMDEPNSALDPMAEAELLEQFEKLYKNSMLLMVSHRLYNSFLMNKIIVLKDGCIVEEGEHSALMEKRGYYFDMYSIQAKKYKSTEQKQQ